MEGFSSQPIDPFAQGLVSMCSYGNWMIESYAQFPDLDFGGSGAMPVPAKFKGKKVNWSCGWTFVIDPNTKLVEESWKLIKWLEGPEYVRAAGTVGLDLTTKDWERQKLPGKPIFAPTPPVYKPAMEVMEKEYYSKLPDNLKKLMASYLDSENFAVGCGKIAGLAAAELWTGFKNSWEAGLDQEEHAERGAGQCQEGCAGRAGRRVEGTGIGRPHPPPSPDDRTTVVTRGGEPYSLPPFPDDRTTVIRRDGKPGTGESLPVAKLHPGLRRGERTLASPMLPLHGGHTPVSGGGEPGADVPPLLAMVVPSPGDRG